jgi:uncharacterized protein (TIGR00255 family)
LFRSMTAYGRADYRLGETLFIAEIRSLNNRYRDITLRIPKNYQLLENDLRAIISSKIKRGRVEASIQMEKAGSEDLYDLELNVPLVNSYSKIFNQLAEQFGLDQGVKIDSLCQMKDVIIVKPREVELEEVSPGFQGALRKALDSLELMRTKEGEAIEADFEKRLDLFEQYLNQVEERAPSLAEEYRNRLKENIHRMLGDVNVDQNRLAQEVAIFAERSDITEEIVRIKSHLNQFRDYLMVDDPIGRRLDFLIQEINREVNTLGVKASDSLVSKIVVEMKAELEKLREQAQNLE